MPDTIEELLEDQVMSFEGFRRADVAMVVSNPNLKDNPIVYVNEAFTRSTGYARSAVIGRNCRFLQGPNTEKKDVDKLRAAIAAEESVAVDILNYRANGEAYTNRLVVAPILDPKGRTQFFVGIQTEPGKASKSANAEQVDAQLMEVQDRVTSDLSMIIGMIKDQAGHTSVPKDFLALNRRIETLQLLYEEMKLSDARTNRDQVQMGSYLSRLAVAIAHTESRSGIRLNLQIEPLEMPINIAARVGLLMSELAANAFQHAFDRIDTGLVDIRMSRLSGGGLRLVIADDGVGVPRDVEWPHSDSIGGRVISGLIERLDGTLQLNRGTAGSVFTIEVPADAAQIEE